MTFSFGLIIPYEIRLVLLAVNIRPGSSISENRMINNGKYLIVLLKAINFFRKTKTQN